MPIGGVALGIIDNAKELADLIKKVGDVELYRKIVELEGEIIELTRQTRAQQEEIERLKSLLATKEKMVFRKPFYFLDGDPHPYCPKCWEVDKITVHLDGPAEVIAGPRYDCPNCKTHFIDV